MRKLVGGLAILAGALLSVPGFAQEATQAPEATQASDAASGQASVTVSDQAVLDGRVIVEAVTTPVNGWLAIHADMEGMPGHVTGIAPLAAGDNANVAVLIDGAMSTPVLHVLVHEDTGEIGVFEHAVDPSLDPPVSPADAMTPLASFNIAAIFAYDQGAVGDNVVVASVITPEGGWLVIHADADGSPGAVLGQTPVTPGTIGPVIVPMGLDGRTPVVYPMLHVDDTTIGTYEFGAVEGADAPISINGVVAFRPVTLGDTFTLLLADGTPIDSDIIPSLIAPPQEVDISGETAAVSVDLVSSPGAGFVDVHNDVMGHPGGSLGHAPVSEGDNTGVIVNLTAQPMVPLTGVVWPMLHLDTDGDGVYQYLQVPGEDPPVIMNGMVVALPVTLGEGQ
ncbi:MAG: hypothetical protein SF162_19975 [bacterium]|nr:hypothetical protein [bacterium]